MVHYKQAGRAMESKFIDLDLTNASVDIEAYAFKNYTGGLVIDGSTATLKKDAECAFAECLFDCLTVRNLHSSEMLVHCDYMMSNIEACEIVLENVSVDGVSFVD